jgi:hypothetical protein
MSIVNVSSGEASFMVRGHLSKPCLELSEMLSGNPPLAHKPAELVEDPPLFRLLASCE